MIILKKRIVLAIGYIFTVMAGSAFSDASSQSATESDWHQITKSNDLLFSARVGSFQILKTKEGDPIALVIGRTENTTKKSFQYNKWYVSTKDCDEGIGSLVILEANGDYLTEIGFVAKGDNIASRVAGLICGSYFLTLESENASETQRKGVANVK